MIAPKVVRDWSKVAPYDYLESDDVTWNHPFAVPGADGKPRLVRGECILNTAQRVGYIVHYTLIAGMIEGQKSSYNQVHVRSNLLAVHDKIGLPNVGLSLENNVFAARMICGEQRPHWREIDNRTFEQGLRHPDLNLDLHYHKPATPWTKPIERVIGMVQDRMNCEPGYVGRNERMDRREDVQQAMRAVASGKSHSPSKRDFCEFEEFAEKLDAIITEYNREAAKRRNALGFIRALPFHPSKLSPTAFAATRAACTARPVCSRPRNAPGFPPIRRKMCVGQIADWEIEIRAPQISFLE